MRTFWKVLNEGEMRDILKIVLSFLVMALLAAACSSPEPEPTPTPEPSATPLPTSTPEPTATPTQEPTATPDPTASPTVSPTPFLVIQADGLCSVSIGNGVLSFAGPTQDKFCTFFVQEGYALYSDPIPEDADLVCTGILDGNLYLMTAQLEPDALVDEICQGLGELDQLP